LDELFGIHRDPAMVTACRYVFAEHRVDELTNTPPA